jgi:hypothetical protein
MRILFDHLRSSGWDAIEEWLLSHECESVHLEFKKKVDPTTTGLDDHDRAELARTISGFANTSGGILVLGLDTKTGQRRGDPDRVTRAVEISDVERFAARIENELHKMTDPAVPGVGVLAITNPNKAGSGVVAVHVPASDGGPHRAIVGTADVIDHYYMRTGSSTVVIPHAVLGGFFGRRSPPLLQLAASLTTRETSAILLHLRNIGRGSALNAAVVLDDPPSAFTWRNGSSLGPNWRLLWHMGNAVQYTANADIVMYPGFEVLVVQALANERVTAPVALRGTLYCRDTRGRAFDLLATPGGQVFAPPIVDEP